MVEPGLWSLRRLITAVLLIFIAQLVLIFWLSDRTPPSQRRAAPAPSLALLPAGGSPLLALEDPTLFAMPHTVSFSGLAWLKPLPSEYRPFEWNEDYRFLPLAAGPLGATFREFVGASRTAPPPWVGRAEPMLTVPVGARMESPPERSTLRMSGDLQDRVLLQRPPLPAIANGELLTNSIVRLVITPGGNPVSLALVTKSGSAAADQLALDQARTARFAPLNGSQETAPNARPESLVWGEMIFEWATLPLPATNGIGATAP
jgi:hypothetical protein